MADTKITALTAITTVDPAVDVLPIVDVSDTSMAASGTTKKITSNQILGAGGTATLASATITGDLTVDTSTLKVDSTNNRVGIGTASPGYLLDVQAATAVANILSTTGTNTAYLQISNTGGYFYLGRENSAGTTFAAPAYSAVLYAGGAYPLVTTVNGGERYRIASDGVATWSNVGGVAGTAMTLNSTGLGVGGSPTAKISCAGYSSANQLPDINIARSSSGTAIQTGPNIVFADGTSNNTVTIQNSQGRFGIWNYGAGSWNERFNVDASGNCGIGVTPSAWSNVYKAFQIGQSASVSAANGSELAVFGSNCYFDTTDSRWERITSGYTSQYYQTSGTHVWRIGGTAAANTDCSFTQAMTLDASGNLLVGGTSSPLASRVSLFTTFAQPDGIVIRNTGATAGLYWRFGAVNNSNTLFVMNASSVGVTMADGASAWSAVSDERFKDIIEPISNAVAKVSSLRSVIGKYKSDAEGIRRSFLIAQDVKSVLPEAVDSTDTESLGLRYTEVIPLLVAAIKELTARVQTLEAK